MIDFRQPVWRLDQDQTVHTVGHMHPHGGRRAVVYVNPFVQCLERELRFMSGCGKARCRAAAGTGHAVQVDVVRHFAAGMVLEVKLDRIALSHANEAARYGTAERPEGVAHAFGDRHFLFGHLQFHDHLCRIFPRDRRRHKGRAGQECANRLALRRAEIARCLGGIQLWRCRRQS